MAKRKKAEKVVADVGLSLNSLQLASLQRLIVNLSDDAVHAENKAAAAANAAEILGHTVDELINLLADAEAADES